MSDEPSASAEDAQDREAPGAAEEAGASDTTSGDAPSGDAPSDDTPSGDAADAQAEAEADAPAAAGVEEEAPPPAREPDPEPSARPTPGEVLIQAEDLCKYYGRFTAIEGVSFDVRRGEVVAFLGPNGAGKSTTMKLLTGVLAPDRGEARIAGLSVIHHRIEVAHKLGYLPENGPLYLEMTPRDLLRFLGAARGLEGARLRDRVDDVVEKLDLGTVLNKPIEKLSKGFRQRVGLAQALLHEPDVLIMDEPTSGLDPNQIRDVRRIIRDMARDKAILLSTHILQEVEAVADRVVFISRGRVVYQGSVEGLREAGHGSLDEAFALHTAAVAGGGAA